jgi:hypothetical protein
MQEYLRPDKNFTPCPSADEDELFPNGIFIFNISRMLSAIRENPDLFPVGEVAVKEIYSVSPYINEGHLDAVNVSEPVLLAEIAPGRYNLIDGHHRVEKAHRLKIETLKAYRLKANQHISFLTTQKGYDKYVEYWNDKIKAQRRQKRY